MRHALSIVIFVFALFLNSAFAQAYKDSIQVQFVRYTECLAKKDYAAAVEYMNPDFFKIIPKDRMVKIIEQIYNNPEMEVSMKPPKINSIGDVKFINAQHYAKFNYSTYMILRPKEAEEEGDKELLIESFQESFGKENVTYDEKVGTYNIFLIQEVVANSIDQRNWTFVVIDEKQKPVLERFIPKELL